VYLAAGFPRKREMLASSDGQSSNYQCSVSVGGVVGVSLARKGQRSGWERAVQAHVTLVGAVFFFFFFFLIFNFFFLRPAKADATSLREVILSWGSGSFKAKPREAHYRRSYDQSFDKRYTRVKNSRISEREIAR